MNFKRNILGAATVGLLLACASTALAQPAPSHYRRYIRDITGTNTTITAATTFTNISGTTLAAFKFENLAVRGTGKADGTSTNAVLVFRKVLNEGDVPPRLLTADNHFNLVLVPDAVASQTVTMMSNFPSTVALADGYWQAWMLTNGGCNWTNVTIEEIGRTGPPSP